MIKELTQEQIEQFPKYVDKWLKIGLSTQSCDKEKAQQAVKEAYKVAGLKEPTIFIWLDSPIAGCYGAEYLNQLDKYLKDNKLILSDLIGSQVYNSGWGSNDSGWLSYYNYFYEICNLECTKRLQPLMNLAENCGWWWPFENVVIMTEKPIEIHMKNGRLHNEKGPSILYKDGFSVYSLNGVKVPEWVVKTNSEDINPKDILKETNVEIRRELFRKVGAQRVLEKLGANVLHTYKDYELVEIDLGNNLKGRWLKMVNQSIGCIHVEGVPNDGYYKIINKKPKFQPYDIVKIKGTNYLSIVTEVYLNQCQDKDEHQWSFSVVHIDKNYPNKNSWYSSKELIYMNNIFEIIAKKSKDPFGSNSYEFKLKRRSK